MRGSRGEVSVRVALFLSAALCAMLIFRVANNVAPWDVERSSVWHHFEYLTEGFMRGHTYLSVEPSPELLKLKDPYDPTANEKVRLWDASLYQGKYYLYYGPGPVLALMLPWRLLTGHMLPQRLAVALFATASLVGLACLIFEVRRRHFPKLSALQSGAILAVAFHASWLPIVLRRPGVWELPIISAEAFLWWSIYFLWKFRDTGGRLAWAMATGASLALMIACRANNLFEAGLVLLLLAPFSFAGARRPPGWMPFVGAAAIVCAGGVALLAYNWCRFGSWHEFGQSYMLSGRDQRSGGYIHFDYIPFNMWSYLLARPEVGPYFPFLHAAWPESFPRGYLGYEAMYGALFAMPVQLAGFAALSWAWRSRADASTRATGIAIAAAVGSSVFAAAFLFCWQGACSRYIEELFAGWTVVSSLGLMVIYAGEGAFQSRRLIRSLARAASCWTIVCVWLASAEFRGFMRQTNPKTYITIAHALDYPSEWWIRAKGIHFGPADLDVRLPAGPSRGETVLLATGFPEKVNQLVVDRIDADHVRLILNGNEDSVFETPRITTPTDRMHIRLSAPWLYPPPEHPYWDRFSDPSQCLELQTRFSLELGKIVYQTHSTHYFDASGFVPAVQEANGPSPATPYVESFGPAGPGL